MKRTYIHTKNVGRVLFNDVYERDFCAILDKRVCTTTLYNINEDEYDNISSNIIN